MKTATSSTARKYRWAVTAAAGLATIGLGLSVPLSSVAQDSSTRTLATGSHIPLAADAPDRYTVKRGDTLWDIAKVFLREPWYWPEIWYLNPQVANPHKIYPGDVLALVNVDGQPRLTIQERAAGGPDVHGGSERLSPHVRSTPIDQSITAIPAETIQAFAGRPTILTSSQVKSGPHLLAMRDRHVVGGAGVEVYAGGMKEAAPDSRYSIIHVDQPVRDPQSNKLLGYRGIYVGAANVVDPGNPTKLVLTETAREALLGDKLYPESSDIPLDFVPHAPNSDVHGAIAAVSGVSVAGQYDVIAINRGTKHGLEAGNVLAILQRGEVIRDKYGSGGVASDATSVGTGFGKRVRLPDERLGVAMVFKTYENMSYALIMEATHPVRVGDLIGNP